MPDELRIASETEWRAWIAYYDAQAALFAELAEGALSAEQCAPFRDREHTWREKARHLRESSFRRSAEAMTRISTGEHACRFPRRTQSSAVSLVPIRCNNTFEH